MQTIGGSPKLIIPRRGRRTPSGRGRGHLGTISGGRCSGCILSLNSCSNSMKKVQVSLSPFYRWICWDMERGKKTLQITWNLGGPVGVGGQISDLTSRLSCRCAVDFSGGCPLKAGVCQRSPMGADICRAVSSQAPPLGLCPHFPWVL